MTRSSNIFWQAAKKGFRDAFYCPWVYAIAIPAGILFGMYVAPRIGL